MVKVRAIISFNDLQERVPREIGDEFKVTEERKDFLLQHKAVEVVEEKVVKEEIIAEPILEVEKESQRKPKEEKKSQRTSKK